MKLYLAALVCWIASCGILYAQKSTYLKAEVGFGRGAVRAKSAYRATAASWQPVSASRFAATGGVQMKKLNVEIGFGYSRTGGRYTNALLWTSYINPEGRLATTQATHRISHLTMPVTVGYELRAGKRWAVQPRIGLEGAYTLGSRLADISVTDGGEGFMVAKEAQPLKAFSLHSSTALHLHYRVTPSIEIFGGPSYRHMLTNGAKETLYVHPPFYKLRTTSATFDAGVKLQLNSPSTPKRAPQE